MKVSTIIAIHAGLKAGKTTIEIARELGIERKDVIRVRDARENAAAEDAANYAQDMRDMQADWNRERARAAL